MARTSRPAWSLSSTRRWRGPCQSRAGKLSRLQRSLLRFAGLTRAARCVGTWEGELYPRGRWVPLALFGPARWEVVTGAGEACGSPVTNAVYRGRAAALSSPSPDLADLLGADVSPQALSRALRRLEARKLLDVRRSAGGRATHVALTPDGGQVLTVSEGRGNG
jgi:hypothetical protein